MHPRARLTLLAAATFVLLAALGIVLSSNPTVDRVAGSRSEGSLRPTIPPKDVQLFYQQGQRARRSDQRGRVVILTFLYSTCHDTWPITATTIRGALDDLGHDVPVFAVSVDPAHDTAARARRFLVRQQMVRRMSFLL